MLSCENRVFFFSSRLFFTASTPPMIYTFCHALATVQDMTLLYYSKYYCAVYARLVEYSFTFTVSCSSYVWQQYTCILLEQAKVIWLCRRNITVQICFTVTTSNLHSLWRIYRYGATRQMFGDCAYLADRQLLLISSWQSVSLFLGIYLNSADICRDSPTPILSFNLISFCFYLIHYAFLYLNDWQNG